MCREYFVLTTALLYWSGPANVLPVKVHIINSRRQNSIPVTARKEEEKCSTSLTGCVIFGGFLFIIPQLSLNQHIFRGTETMLTACSSSAASVSLGTRLGGSIGELLRRSSYLGNES